MKTKKEKILTEVKKTEEGLSLWRRWKGLSEREDGNDVGGRRRN